MATLADFLAEWDRQQQVIAKQNEAFQKWTSHREECQMCASWYEETEYGEDPPECHEYWAINAS